MPKNEYILAPTADWSPAEWASADVQAIIGVKSAFEIKRGINLGVSGEIGVSLAAMVANFVAVDVSAEAHASVELKGQAQVLLDLFDEVGVAIRLRASAELGVSVKLGIGLSTKQFLELAKNTDLISADSVQMELLETLLDEVVLEAGVAGKAALSAMAYANLSITGRLIRNGNEDGAGFYLLGDFGAGLEGGAGYQMFAKAGLVDPDRLIQKTVDIAVDKTIAKLAPFVSEVDINKAEHYVSLLWQLRAPAKMAIRIAYETGMALSDDYKKKISKGIAKEVALRGVKIAVEEAQPYVLELLLQWAIECIQIESGLNEDNWNNIASLLNNQRPPQPFSVSDTNFETNLKYWNDVINELDKIVTTTNELQTKAAPYLGMVWGAIHLLFIMAKLKEAISNSKATPEIQTLSAIELPESVLKTISEYLRKQSLVTINHQILVEFITKKTNEYFDKFIIEDSSAEVILRILVGGNKRKEIKNTLLYLIEHAGITYTSGNRCQLISLETVHQGLNWYIQEKVDKQLIAIVKNSSADELLKNMFTDVLVASLSFTTDSIITAVLNYSDNSKTAIREACSAILMRLLARSLVVTTDILLATAMNGIQRAMNNFDKNIDPVINKLSESYKTDNISTVLHETVDISAKVFNASGLVYQKSRPEIRNLLYKLIDGNMQYPVAAGIPHRDELVKLAEYIVKILEHNIVGFTKELLLRIGNRLYTELLEIVDDVNYQITVWETELSNVHGNIEKRIIIMTQQLEDLEKEIYKSIELQVKHTNIMLDYISSHHGEINKQLKLALHNKAIEIVPKISLPLADKVINTFEPTIALIIVDACKEIKKSRDLLNTFLKDAHNLGSNGQLAECLGAHLGKIVATKLQIIIPVPLKPITVKVPENIVIEGFKKGMGLSVKIVAMADPLLNLLIHVTEIEHTIKTTTTKSKKAIKHEIYTKNLIDSKPAEDARIEIISPLNNQFISKAETVAIKILFEKIPLEYLATNPLEQPRVLVWINQILIDLHTVETEVQSQAFILTLSADLLRSGPNIVTVIIADGTVDKQSVGFFMEVHDSVKGHGLWLSDNEMNAGITRAKASLVEKSTSALDLLEKSYNTMEDAPEPVM